MRIKREKHAKEGYSNFIFTPETKEEYTICCGLCLHYCEKEIDRLQKLLFEVKK